MPLQDIKKGPMGLRLWSMLLPLKTILVSSVGAADGFGSQEGSSTTLVDAQTELERCNTGNFDSVDKQECCAIYFSQRDDLPVSKKRRWLSLRCDKYADVLGTLSARHSLLPGANLSPPTPPAAGLANATVVTAFYRMPSKHRAANYARWAANVLQTGSPMVVFTDQLSLTVLKKMRPRRLLAQTRFLVKSLQAHDWLKGYNPAFWKRQHDQLDPERHGAHSSISPDLYKIWDSKLEMVVAVAESNPFFTDTFWWVDIGALRDKKVFPDPWPSPSVLAHLPRDRVVVGQVASTIDPSGVSDELEGGFFGGTASSVKWYAAAFYAELANRARANRFIGKDQTIMNVVFARNRDKFAVLESFRSATSRCGINDAWFAFFSWMSGTDCGGQPLPLVCESRVMTNGWWERLRSAWRSVLHMVVGADDHFHRLCTL